jgi:hypothetical protein
MLIQLVWISMEEEGGGNWGKEKAVPYLVFKLFLGEMNDVEGAMGPCRAG